ncbi:hypothetical protein [Rhodopila sp.]|uniref:hypothetical protein n=1 Tax=Rhodopila sp. TaxID=2480087 RepID=UPI003D0B1D19
MHDPDIIIVHGGLPGGEAMQARVGGKSIAREPGETLDAFQARAVDAAWYGEHPFVVIGGLPA